MLDLLQYPGAFLGILGALLVSLKRNRQGMDCWIVGNSCWVVYGIHASEWAIFAQFAVFLVIAAFGAWNYRRS